MKKFGFFIILIVLFFGGIVLSCPSPTSTTKAGEKEEDKDKDKEKPPVDTTPPAEVTSLVGHADIEKVTWIWVDPADADLDHIEITFDPSKEGIAQPIRVTKGVQTVVIEPLTALTSYAFVIRSVDATGNISRGHVRSITPLQYVDTTPPAEVTSVGGTVGEGSATLTWTDPTDADLDHIEITWTPDGPATPVIVDPGEETYTATGLDGGTSYDFTIVAVDAAGNKNTGVTVTVLVDIIDVTPPGEISGLVTIVSAGGGINFTWNDPADLDLDHIEITFSPEEAGITQPVTVGHGVKASEITGFTKNFYTFTFITVDQKGNKSAGISSTAYFQTATSFVNTVWTDEINPESLMTFSSTGNQVELSGEYWKRKANGTTNPAKDITGTYTYSQTSDFSRPGIEPAVQIWTTNVSDMSGFELWYYAKDYPVAGKRERVVVYIGSGFQPREFYRQ